MTLPAALCRSCQRVDLPPADRCPVCAGPTEGTTVDGRGTVLARTQVTGETWVLLVELDQGARGLARAEATAPSIGDQVALGPAEDGLTLRVPR